MSEQLLCGAAREVITPPAEMIDHLSGLMNSSFGQHHKLKIRYYTFILSC